jgi:hypothetical protein
MTDFACKHDQGNIIGEISCYSPDVAPEFR